ncbi:MAG: hypothetical protein SGPRY_004885, partial [Prymnesium sp.]
MAARCAAASVCSTRRCEATLSFAQTASLVAASVLPILFSLVLPRLDHLSKRALPLMGGAMWVLPIECATSAHIAILFAMVMAILPLFFMLILSTAPCATAIGACATISCAAGNVYVEGYAVVLLTIMLTSAFLVRDFAALHCVTNSQRRLRAGLVMGSLGLQLTGIFPMHFSKHAPGTDNWYFYALSLHALGLVFAGTTLVNVPFVCFWRARHVLRLDAKRLTGIRVVYVSA